MGDFNLAASVIAESGFCGHSGLAVQAPPADQPTHRSAAGTHNIIDIFLVSSGLAEAGPATTTDETIDFRPHRPIKLILPIGFGHRWMRSWVLPPALPRLRVFGPLLPARAGYEEVATDCMHTLNRVEGLSDTEVQRRLSQAYLQWAALAEHDLEHITGTEPRGRQHRGRMVRLAWRRVLCTDRLSALAPLSRAGRVRRIYHQAELAACSLAGLRFADAGRQWSQAVVAWHSFVVDDGDEFFDEAWLRLQRAFDTAKAGMESMEVANLAEDEAVAEDINELFACIAEWAGMATQAGKDQKNHERREWRQWARDALEQGARRAYRHMKKGEQRWMATLVPDLAASGGRSAAPAQVLEHELAKWAAVWDAEPQDEDRPRPFLPPGLPARGFGGQGSPALATPQGLRDVAISFKSTTAMREMVSHEPLCHAVGCLPACTGGLVRHHRCDRLDPQADREDRLPDAAEEEWRLQAHRALPFLLPPLGQELGVGHCQVGAGHRGAMDDGSTRPVADVAGLPHGGRG